MNYPSDLRYTKDHEWVRAEGGRATVGITDHAQESLGDIVFVEIPTVGAEVARGEEASTVESVKASSPIFAPVSGTIVEVNEALDKNPELLNQKPYEAFVFTIEMNDRSELDDLLTVAQYQALVDEEAKDS